jgi:hypothetical protein
VYFSVALARTGHFSEAQVLLFEAAKGKDAALCQTALEYLARFEKVQ